MRGTRRPGPRVEGGAEAATETAALYWPGGGEFSPFPKPLQTRLAREPQVPREVGAGLCRGWGGQLELWHPGVQAPSTLQPLGLAPFLGLAARNRGAWAPHRPPRNTRPSSSGWKNPGGPAPGCSHEATHTGHNPGALAPWLTARPHNTQAWEKNPGVLAPSLTTRPHSPGLGEEPNPQL